VAQTVEKEQVPGIDTGTESRRWWECGAGSPWEWAFEGEPNRIFRSKRAGARRSVNKRQHIAVWPYAQSGRRIASSRVAPQGFYLLSQH